MNKINVRYYDSTHELNDAAAAIMKHHLERDLPGMQAVMLAGGQTPLDSYRKLAASSCIIAENTRLFLSDERLVPDVSPLSNYGNLRFLIEGLGLANDQFVRVPTELKPEQAAQAYNDSLRHLVNSGAHFSLGLLGLGADGHTASLFSTGDLDLARGRYAVAVMGPDKLNRISVTPDFLAKINQIIFVVAGKKKLPVVKKLSSDPGSVIAGLAVAGVRMKEIWFTNQEIESK